MSAPMDLNILAGASNTADVISVLRSSSQWYGTVALNTNCILNATGKKGKNKTSPDPYPTDTKIDDGSLQEIYNTSKNFKQLSRVTLQLVEPSAVARLTDDRIQQFDIVAALPTTEKLFHMACSQLDVDMISFDMTAKCPFRIKRESVNEALRRGLFFEICYTPAIKDSMARRYTIGNALRLVNVCKGKNIILTSQAERSIDLRGPYDVANLGALFGLKEEQAKNAVTTNCRALLKHAEARRLKASKAVLSIEPIISSGQTESSLSEQIANDEDYEPTGKRAKVTEKP